LLRGKVFYLYLAIYAFVRFFDEFLRGDALRGFVFGLSTSQFISIFIEAFALAMLLLPIIKKKYTEKKTSV
jgi:phosphatidylglycerol:prolipoprotein diacylglycerol transferase